MIEDDAPVMPDIHQINLVTLYITDVLGNRSSFDPYSIDYPSHHNESTYSP